jgi:hypothetical protein
LFLQLLAIVQPLFSAYLTNLGQTIHLFIGWLVLQRSDWVTNQNILSLGFRQAGKSSIKLQQGQYYRHK